MSDPTAVFQCLTCQVVKDVSEFYKEKKTILGIFKRCKICVNLATRQNRLANLEARRDYDRLRGLDAKRQAENQKRAKDIYRKDGRALKWAKDWQKRNPEKLRAQQILQYSVKKGTIRRRASCESCGYNKHITAHHEDYSRPLSVLWLCRSCHGRRHRELNAEQRSSGIENATSGQ